MRPQWIGGVSPPPFFLAGARMQAEQRQPWQQLRDHYLATGAIEAAEHRTHVSPAFLIPKASGGWRLVVDLRRLNSYCVPLRCRFETLRALGRLARRGDWMVSFDLQDGYHCVPIHPDARRFFTFQVGGEYFQCSALPFGWLNAPFVFTKVMRPLVAYLRAPAAAAAEQQQRQLRRGRQQQQQQRCAHRAQRVRPVTTGPLHLRTAGIRLLPYLDDFLCLLPTEREAHEAATFVQRTLASLGLLWHPTKSRWQPTQSLAHLGLQVDTRRGQFQVTPERQRRLRASAKALLCDAARYRRAVRARAVAQFAGLAVATALAIPAARFYLRSLYDALNTKKSWAANVVLSRQCLRDLEWWLDLPARSTRRAIWRDPATATLHCDASGFAWGAVLNQVTPARGFWSQAERLYHITWKELAAVHRAVVTFLPHLRDREVRLFEDNQAVVSVLRGLSSRSAAMMAELRRLWAVLDAHDVRLRPEYIRSADNVAADGLSRLQLREDDLRLHPSRFSEADRWWGPHTTDCFASQQNRQVPRYFSEYADPETAGVDAFARSIADWRAHNNWANPPWRLLSQLVHHLEVSGAACTVVAPYWRAQPWFGPLLAITRRYVVWEPAPDIFLPGHLGGEGAVGPPAWRVIVCRVPLRPQRRRP